MNNWGSRVCRAITVGLTVLGFARTTAAQRVTFDADIGDVATGAPLQGAEVWLPQLHRLARTDSLGRARIDSLPLGVYRVRVRRLGYVGADVQLAFRGDSVREAFLLGPVPTVLDTVTTSARVISPALNGFDRRRQMGIARVLTERQLDSARTVEFPVLLESRFPGLTARFGTGHTAHIVGLRPGSCGGALGSDRCQYGCAIQIYLDGTRLPDDDVSWIYPDDLSGVEYYDGPSAPVQYRIAGSDCGVLLLWSKP